MSGVDASLMKSEYGDVIAGKLRLKGKALDVKSKRKKHRKHHEQLYSNTNMTTDVTKAELNLEEGEGNERLTAAERRYLERCQQVEMQRLAKSAAKSHRDRIQEFNQYLANLTEHYDIPKVGPG